LAWQFTFACCLHLNCWVQSAARYVVEMELEQKICRVMVVFERTPTNNQLEILRKKSGKDFYI